MAKKHPRTIPGARSTHMPIIVLCAGLLAPAAGAAPLFTQLPQDGEFLYLSSISGTNDVGAQIQNADDFTAPDAVRIDSIKWWGSRGGSQFTIRFLNDVNGAPQTQTPFAFEVNDAAGVTSVACSDPSASCGNPNVSSPDGEVFEYEYVIPGGLQLAAGKHYLAVSGEGGTWGWMGAALGASWVRSIDGDDWLPSEPNLAFQVNGERLQVIPEPGVLALLSWTALLVGARRLRRRGL